jgi:hypothetical protein
MSLAFVFGLGAVLHRKRPPVAAATAKPTAAKPARPVPRELAPLDPIVSYEPFRDYRPGSRAGDPYRPW